MPSSPYTFRMDDELRQALEDEARLEDRPTAQLAVRAIRSMLQAKVSKRAAIDVAIQQADEGAFISQEALNAWMDSWGTEQELPMPEVDIRRLGS